MLSERNWQGEGVLRMLLGLFSTIFAVSLLASSLGQFADIPKDSQGIEMKQMLVRAYATQLIFGIWIVYFLVNQKLSLSSAFGFRARPFRAIALGLMVGICVVPTAWILQFFSIQALQAFDLSPQAQELVNSFRRSAKESHADWIQSQLLFGFSVVVLAPIVEETLFRGILYPTLKNLGIPRIALWTSAVLFALMHFNAAGMLPLLFLGIVLALVYEETDNLLAPIIVHSVFNATNFLFMLLEGKLSKMLLPT